jgi:hypothetical protein
MISNVVLQLRFSLKTTGPQIFDPATTIDKSADAGVIE